MQIYNINMYYVIYYIYYKLNKIICFLSACGLYTLCSQRKYNFKKSNLKDTFTLLIK